MSFKVVEKTININPVRPSLILKTLPFPFFTFVQSSGSLQHKKPNIVVLLSILIIDPSMCSVLYLLLTLSGSYETDLSFYVDCLYRVEKKKGGSQIN